MKLCDIYTIDSKDLKETSVDLLPTNSIATNSYLLDKYLGEHCHVPFIHEEYQDYWEKGIPIIHVTKGILDTFGQFFDSGITYLSVYMPNTVTLENYHLLLNKVEELEQQYPEFQSKNLFYIRDKNSFGYNYEVYPPLIDMSQISFRDAISLFAKDAMGQSSEEEKKMFSLFRNFQLESIIAGDSSVYCKPINHNNCGVAIVNRRGEVLSSTITKYHHSETLTYLFSLMAHADISSYNYNMMDQLNYFSSAIFLFREGDIYSYIPEEITEAQYQELSNFADKIDYISQKENKKIYFSSVRVLPNNNLVDDEFSFRENIARSLKMHEVGDITEKAPIR